MFTTIPNGAVSNSPEASMFLSRDREAQTGGGMEWSWDMALFFLIEAQSTFQCPPFPKSLFCLIFPTIVCLPHRGTVPCGSRDTCTHAFMHVHRHIFTCTLQTLCCRQLSLRPRLQPWTWARHSFSHLWAVYAIIRHCTPSLPSLFHHAPLSNAACPPSACTSLWAQHL